MRIPITIDEFKKRCIERFGDKFNFDKTAFEYGTDKIVVTCPIHGDFTTTPSSMLQRKFGCPKCGNQLKKHKDCRTQKEFIDEYQKRNIDYDTSKVIYTKSNVPITLICHHLDKFGREHGEFKIRPNDLFNGKRCPKCSGKHKYTFSDVIEIGNIVHNGKYKYKFKDIQNGNNEFIAICPIHGDFITTAKRHLRGDGCPKCKQSKMEIEVMKMLEDSNIDYIYQYKYEKLGNKSIDFYLPTYNVAIECQGGQHFKSVDFFGGEDCFKQTVKRDIEKHNIIVSDNKRLIYIIPHKFIKYHNLPLFEKIYNRNYLVYEDILQDKQHLFKKIV